MLKKVKPRALDKGDTIRLVSPASPITPAELEGVRHLLESAGFRVEFGAHVFDRWQYLAGTDQDRAADVMEAFLDPEVAAVMCSRGGYGCPRLLPYVDLPAIVDSAKMFLGFSDITTLHVALNKLGLATFYSPMGFTLATKRAEWTVQSFLNALLGQDPLDVDHPRATCVVAGTAQGETVGGCLVPFIDSFATPDEIHTDGKILLIEDVGERPHRVDALLTHLVRSGKIQRCAGIVVGEMTDTDALSQKTPDGKLSKTYAGVSWRDIVTERLAPLGLPLMIDFPFGHIANMLTVPLGIQVSMDSAEGKLKLLENTTVGN